MGMSDEAWATEYSGLSDGDRRLLAALRDHDPTDDDASPIWIPCEGSGQPAAKTSSGTRLCAMCGRLFFVYGDGTVEKHQRRDVLAMLGREGEGL